MQILFDGDIYTKKKMLHDRQTDIANLQNRCPKMRGICTRKEKDLLSHRTTEKITFSQ